MQQRHFIILAILILSAMHVKGCERSISLDFYDRVGQNHFNGSVTMHRSIAVITAQGFVYLIGKYCGLRCGFLANLSKWSGAVSQVLNKPGFNIKLFK